MRFCSTFGSILWKFLCYVAVLQFYKTKRFVVFKNLGVISMWFAVFLCYSVRCLYVLLCSVYTYFCTVLQYLFFPYVPLLYVFHVCQFIKVAEHGFGGL